MDVRQSASPVAKHENYDDIIDHNFKKKIADGSYAKVTVVANRAKLEWKKMSLCERAFRWVFSRLLPCLVASTAKKCRSYTEAALNKYNATNHAKLELIVRPVPTQPKLAAQPKPVAPAVIPTEEPVPAQPKLAAQPKPVAPAVIPTEEPAPAQPLPLDVQDGPLDASTFGFKVESDPKRGFPDVDIHLKQKVLDATKAKLSELVKGTELTPEGQELFDSLKSEIEFYPIQENTILAQNKSEDFINPGEVVQTPVMMEYDEKFEKLPFEPKHFFYMHSTPAPKAKGIDIKNPAVRLDYLAKMKATVKAGMEAQIKPGCKMIIWNYFGMGAFLRGVISDRKEMYELRKEIAAEFFAAFDEVLATMPPEKQKEFKLLIAGPTGESFSPELQEEPRDNYNAFVVGATASKYKENLVFCPETDAFVKAQEIAETMKIEGKVAPVSVMNAADSKILGNHWFKGISGTKMNANFAIDENGHRRSPKMSFFTYKVNGGFAVKKGAKCSEAVDKLKKPAS